MTRDFQEALSQFQEQGIVSKESFDASTVENLEHTIITAMGGVEIKDESEPTGYRREGGAISVIAGLMGTLYSVQPASSVEYLADVGQNFGLVPKAYAQGVGWQAFSPVLSLWKTFRNIAYLAFIIIFVVIGFMIMFRKKIDPQTVISVQNALPKIVVTLILITFSYAIAGFIIDSGQLATRIIGNLLVKGDFLGTSPLGPEASLKDLLSSNIFKLINPLRNVDELVRGLGEVGVGPIEVIEKIPLLGNLTIKAVFWIAGFFIMFKIFFALIGPYVGIVLSVVFAPLQLLLGAIPGTQGGLGGWLKNLLANVLVFPVTFAMLCMAAIFKSGPQLSECFPTPSSAFLGPGAEWCTRAEEVIIPWAPATIGNWGKVAGHLISFGILFTIPKVVQMVQSALEIKPSPWGEAAAEEIRGAVGKVPLLGSIVKV